MHATTFAATAHAGQKRDDGTPYILHPLAVATILHADFGIDDPDTLCIALLHDVVEDCTEPGMESIMIEKIKKEFGDNVADGVYILSKNLAPTMQDGRPDIKQYYRRIAESSMAVRMVKVADRIHNLEDMKDWKSQRIARYLEDTFNNVLPIATNTDQRMASRIRDIIADVAKGGVGR